MFIGIGRSQLAVDLAVEADDTTLAGVGDEPDLAALPRLEPRRRASRDIEPEPPRLFPIKGECRVGFVEMVMRTHLDRAVAGIGDRQGYRRSAGIDRDVARRGEEL